MNPDPTLFLILGIALLILAFLFRYALEKARVFGDHRDHIALACKILHIDARALFIDAYRAHFGDSALQDARVALGAYQDYNEWQRDKREEKGYRAPIFLQNYIRSLQIEVF